MPDDVMIVQFPHPGGEHRPKTDEMPWNRGDHRRKFLRAHATYLLDEQTRHGDVAFWGEWEAQSRVVDRWKPQGRLPTVLHEPYWSVPDDNGFRQNTDPFVFGDAFAYTNCRQPRNGKLRKLPAGSMILFGSGQGHGFVLDTVFVVGDDPRPYEIGERPDLGRPELGPLVFDSLATDATTRGIQCVAYRGATPERPVHDTYSFVPCLPFGRDVRFERPLIDCGPYVEPNLRMGAKVTPVSREVAHKMWWFVRQQVLQLDLAVAVKLELPERVDASAAH